MYADPFFSLTAPDPVKIADFIIGIRASATDYAKKAFAWRCGVLLFDASPLSGFISVPNMAFRTQVAGIDELTIQKFLELLRKLSTEEEKYRDIAKIRQDLPPIQSFKERADRVVSEALSWLIEMRETVRNAVASVRRQKETADAARTRIDLDPSFITRRMIFAESLLSVKLACGMADAGVSYFDATTGAHFLVGDEQLDGDTKYAKFPEGFVAIYNRLLVPFQAVGSFITTYTIKTLAAQGHRCTLIDLTVNFAAYPFFLWHFDNSPRTLTYIICSTLTKGRQCPAVR